MPSINKKIDLLTIGNTIMDLEYNVDDSKLHDMAIEKGSMTLIDLDKKNELLDLLGQPVHQCSGGSTANSLYVAKQFNLSCHHLGVIGNDRLAQATLADYKRADIDHSFQDTQVEGDSGCCFVLITPDGERTMLTYLGVSSDFKNGDYLTTVIPQASCLFIEGYLLTNDSTYDLLTSTIIPCAKAANTQLAFSLSDAGLVGFFNERYHNLLSQQFDFIFANFAEAKTISQKESIDDMITFFQDRSKEAIITDNKNGAFTITKEGTLTHTTTAVKPVDTTGAGDSFAGTYLAQRLSNASINDACSRANQIAGIVVSYYGARPSALTDVMVKKI